MSKAAFFFTVAAAAAGAALCFMGKRAARARLSLLLPSALVEVSQESVDGAGVSKAEEEKLDVVEDVGEDGEEGSEGSEPVKASGHEECLDGSGDLVAEEKPEEEEEALEDVSDEVKDLVELVVEAWMSLASVKEQLERTTLKLRDVSGRYEHDRKLWVSAISDLEQKLKLDRVRQECRIRGKDQVCRSLQEKNKELEGQFELKKMELLKGKEEECIILQQKVKEVACKLKERSPSESVAEQKVKELEFKLMEKNQSESLNKNKVQELELKLREQAHFKFLAEQKAKELEEKCQFEMMLKQKVKELEFQIKEKLESESMLQKKVKELEAKLREASEQSDPILLLNSAGINATPIYRRPPRGDETMTEADPQILRNLNSTNKPASGTLPRDETEERPKFVRRRT